jgi:hypothetical protein
MRASLEATEPSLSTASSPPSRAIPGPHGFGTESSPNLSTTSPPPSGLPRRSGSSSRQSSRTPKSPQISPTRKSPGLTIAPPPPPMSNRRLSVTPQARPGAPNSTPPVPAKSPLRALNAGVSSSGVASKRQSRAVAPSDFPPTSPVPPVPPLPEGLCLAPEPPAPPAPGEEPSSPTGQDEVRTPRPSVSASRGSDPLEPPAAALASLSVADNAVSLNSRPPSDSALGAPVTIEDGLAIPQRASSFASSPELPQWSHESRDAGSVAATHGHSDDHARGAVPFPDSLREAARAHAQHSSPAGAHEMLSASPERSKARLSVSTSSTSAPVTPAASIPGRSMQLGDSRPNSEVETISSSGGFPSTYSPDSAPPSAPASSVNLWAVGARYDSPAEENGPGLHARGGHDHQETLIDGVLWGQKRNSSLRAPPPHNEVS